MSYSRGIAAETDLRPCSFLPLIFHIGDHAYIFAALLNGGSFVMGRKFDHAAIGRAAPPPFAKGASRAACRTAALHGPTSTAGTFIAR